jgi:hypothetical protein
MSILVNQQHALKDSIVKGLSSNYKKICLESLINSSNFKDKDANSIIISNLV